MTDAYGTPLLSFPDLRAMGWVGLIVGLGCLGAGSLVGVLIAVEGFRELNGDVMAGFGLIGFLVLFGLGFSLVCLRDIVGKPTWHVSRSHAWRMRGGRAIETITFRDEAQPTVIEHRRNGVTVGYSVRFGRTSLAVPNQGTAHQIADLWRDARRA